MAKLAANEERLRLARDMHDLTGQSLSLITLKSELAARRMRPAAASAELDAVRERVSDIGRVSRQTLQDIREADQRLPAADARRRDHHRPRARWTPRASTSTTTRP